ncbi:MAG: zinc ABC transporter substrate-binding protein [Candidatus Lokiarchaeota archaeon]|nr:zinc ABC transporter substrate-binding protein [Candidatus Lokiarchaeota archaeon]
MIGFASQDNIINEKPTLRFAADPEVRVVATTTILRDFAQQIIGDKGTVTVIIEGGSCPGHYDYSPSDINLVNTADIVFYHGFENATFLYQLLSAAENLDAAYSLSFDAGLGYTQWGAPANALLFVDAICAHLNTTYPILNQTFNENCASFKQQIMAKKIELETLNLNIYNFTGTKAYIMNHQTAFLTWLGFSITGSWNVDDNSMTLSQFSDIINEADQTNAEVIIMNYQSGTEQGAEAAKELGIPSVALLNFPGVYSVTSYLEQLDFNAALLHWAMNDGPDPRPSSGSIGSELSLPLFAVIFIGVAISIVLYRRKAKKV